MCAACASEHRRVVRAIPASARAVRSAACCRAAAETRGGRPGLVGEIEVAAAAARAHEGIVRRAAPSARVHRVEWAARALGVPVTTGPRAGCAGAVVAAGMGVGRDGVA